MDERKFEPELNEELFDLVDSSIEEALDKLGISGRGKYELISLINKNMEKKFENTRVNISHIGGRKLEEKVIVNPNIPTPTVENVKGVSAQPIETKGFAAYQNKSNVLSQNLNGLSFDEQNSLENGEGPKTM